MRVIGTAGHVDHGKSTLVEALTGTHPDRLKEERERQMTIDLGFAWMSLPLTASTGSTTIQGQVEEVGIVDVPGHRDFIENMLAGVGGIDAVLFVVAADEGVMPQTREHLAILNLLQIPSGVVALTKVDLLPTGEDGEDWLELVEADLRQVFANTVLARAPIVRVSARTGQGLDQLRIALSDCLAERPPRPDYGRPRLPIDRIFTITGFGTVVTGTLSDGAFRVGEEIEILPDGLIGRIRGLQTHKRKEEVALPGSRTAVNISGIATDQIQRGDVVTHPGDYQPTTLLDTSFRLLPDVSQPMKHNTEVKLFIGAAEVVARSRLLGRESLLPGEEGWLQLELAQPVTARRGDRYILRRPSPGETLGGGGVLDPHPKSRRKRFSAETLAAMQVLSQGTPTEVLQQALLTLGAAPLRDVLARSNLDPALAQAALRELIAAQQIIFLETPAGETTAVQNTIDWSLSASSIPRMLLIRNLEPLFSLLVTYPVYWNQVSAHLIHELDQYHRENPLRLGMPREELKSRIKPFLGRMDGLYPRTLPAIAQRLLTAALRRLAIEGHIHETGPLVLRPGHTIQFNPAQERSIQHLLERFAASPLAPPSVKECQAEVGEGVFTALVESGRLTLVSSEVVFRTEDFQRMTAEVRRQFEQHETLTAAQVRDYFNTSRKYVLAFLEYLDSQGITVRQGDVRRLKRG